jgi:hypothetical protein
MARLPDPVMEQIRIEPDGDVENRKKQFFQMVALAVTKASRKRSNPCLYSTSKGGEKPCSDAHVTRPD